MDYEFSTLVKLAKGIRYIQEALAILSGFLLMIGLVFSMSNILTDSLLNSIPGAQVVWAVSQAIAVDANLLLTWARAAKAFREKQWGAFAFLAFIGTVLLIVAAAVTDLESTQQALRISLAQAAQVFGLSIQSIIHIRSVVVAALAALIGWSYFAFPQGMQARQQQVISMDVDGEKAETGTPSTGEMDIISPEQLQRLQDAYTRLKLQGYVSVNLLQKTSQVRREIVSAWLRRQQQLEGSNHADEQMPVPT